VTETVLPTLRLDGRALALLLRGRVRLRLFEARAIAAREPYDWAGDRAAGAMWRGRLLLSARRRGRCDLREQERGDESQES
jgi:hypothetical protein